MRKLLIRALKFCALNTVLLPFLIYAQEQNVNPGINIHYNDPDYSQWVGTFENPAREIYRQRHQIVNMLGLKPGMDVADIGAGTGFLSLIMASRVGEKGKVYAVDIAKNFIDNILLRAEQQGLPQLIGIVNDGKNVGLKASSIDIALICDTYHHFEFPLSMMNSLYLALRNDGELFIIDYRKVSGASSSWVMGHVRLNKQQVIDEVEAVGFRFVTEQNILRSNYFLHFKK